MTDELRAAAELCINKMNEYGYLPGSFVDECIPVLQAYLAEHPADDDEPVTEEWLLSIEHRVVRDGVISVV